MPSLTPRCSSYWKGVFWLLATMVSNFILYIPSSSSSSSCRAASTDIPDPLSPLLPIVGPQGYIPYPHRAAVRRFELFVLLLLGHKRGSIGEHHMSSSLLLQQCPACLVRLTLIVFVVGGRTSPYIYIYIYIYAPAWGLSTLAKELSAAARIMQSSSKELSTLVADRV